MPVLLAGHRQSQGEGEIAVEPKNNKNELKKALQMTVFILLAFEAVAFLVPMIDGADNYLRMEIGNPVHQVIFAAIALAVGGYTYFRESLKNRKETGNEGEER